MIAEGFEVDTYEEGMYYKDTSKAEISIDTVYNDYGGKEGYYIHASNKNEVLSAGFNTVEELKSLLNHIEIFWENHT